MSLNLERLINPTDRQREFLQAIAEKDFVLYGGAAGGGKSYILRWWLVLYLCWLFAAKGLRNVQVALFCEDYPSLVDRQVSKIRFEFPAELGTLKQGTVMNFVLHEQFGGGIIALRNLDDPSKYLSSEFAAMAVDELTRNKQDVFDFLRLRLRWPGVERPKFAAGTNPGGIGHGWVKKLWILNEFPKELRSKAEQFGFVQAKASDNKHLAPAYYESLLTLPPDMAKAYAEGSWDIFAGQYFDNFTTEVVADARALVIKPWWPKWISMDWGYVHPTAVYWHTRSDDGTVITYRELYRRQSGESDLANAIVEASKGEKIDHLFLSPDAFAKRGSQNTVAQQIGDVLTENGMVYPAPADNDRIGGARLLYQLIGAKQWIISDACPALIECLPQLIRDEDELEDVLKVDWSAAQLGDDPYDAARYGLKSMLDSKVKPFTEVYREKVSAVTDPHARSMYAMRLLSDHAKKKNDGFVPGRLRWNRRAN